MAGIAAALCGCGGAGCAERADERPPRPAAQPAELAFPAELGAACERIARAGSAAVLCPPPARGRAGLALLHEDLDPDPCSYVINMANAATAGEPSHPVLGGSCKPLPLQAGRGPYAVEQPRSLRLVANPPLVSGQAPRTSHPLVLGPTHVRGRPGVLLRVLPFPEGGLHGGSYALVWNERGNGYVVSLHWRSGDLGRPPSSRQVAVLQQLAARMRPVRG